MDDLLISKKKIGFLCEGRVVEFGLRSIKFFRLLWETLAAPVSGPTSCASWVEHAGIFEQSYLHVVFQLLEYASSIVMYCVHVPVATSWLECSAACFHEKAEPLVCQT